MLETNVPRIVPDTQKKVIPKTTDQSGQTGQTGGGDGAIGEATNVAPFGPGAWEAAGKDVVNWAKKLYDLAGGSFGLPSLPAGGGVASDVGNAIGNFFSSNFGASNWEDAGKTIEHLFYEPSGGGKPVDPSYGGITPPTKDPLTNHPWAPLIGYDYKGHTITAQDVQNNVADYTATGKTTGLLSDAFADAMQKQDPKALAAVSKVLHHPFTASKTLSDTEVEKLTALAAKGNPLARELLAKGRYKAQLYPPISKDISNLLSPFVQQMYNLPNMAANLEQQQQQTLAQNPIGSFTQVDDMLSKMGMGPAPAPSPATSAYINELTNALGSTPSLSQTAVPGIPSIDQALKDFGPAAALSVAAIPHESLLTALLSHIQYEIIYGGNTGMVPSTGTPPWLQNLLQLATTGATGGAVLPSIQNAAASYNAVTGSSSGTSTGSTSYPGA